MCDISPLTRRAITRFRFAKSMRYLVAGAPSYYTFSLREKCAISRQCRAELLHVFASRKVCDISPLPRRAITRFRFAKSVRYLAAAAANSKPRFARRCPHSNASQMYRTPEYTVQFPLSPLQIHLFTAQTKSSIERPALSSPMCRDEIYSKTLCHKSS